MRIWCVSIVLTLTFNSFASSETPRPLPMKEKISSSRLLRLLISELPTLLAPPAKLLRMSGNTLAPTYGRPVEISSNALSSSGASSGTQVSSRTRPERTLSRKRISLFGKSKDRSWRIEAPEFFDQLYTVSTGEPQPNQNKMRFVTQK